MILGYIVVGSILYLLIAIIIDRICIKFTDLHPSDRSLVSLFWFVSGPALILGFLANHGLAYLIKGIDSYLTRFEKK